MPRHQHEQHFGTGFQQGLVGGKHDLFFTFVRARGNPHRPVSEQLRAQFATSKRKIRRHLDIELDVAGDSRAFRRGAQRQETLCVRVALRGDDDAVRQRLAKQR